MKNEGIPALAAGGNDQATNNVTVAKPQGGLNYGSEWDISSGSFNRKDESAAADEERRRSSTRVGHMAASMGRVLTHSSRPKWFVCVTCGHEFSARSLPIHAPKCAELWRAERECLPVDLQTTTPRPVRDLNTLPELSEHERLDFNDQTRQVHQNHSSVACVLCGRKFRGFEKLVKHTKNCDGTQRRRSTVHFHLPPGIARVASKKKKAVAPKWLMCCYCGNDFSAEALKFHMPTCVEKWRRDRNRLPADYQTITPRLEELLDVMNLNDTQKVEYNERAKRLYEAHTMIACQKCGRKFDDFNKMVKHRNTCKKKLAVDGNGFAVPEAIKRAVKKRPKDEAPKWFACVHCGLEFGSESLKIHMPQCLEKWRAERERLPEELQVVTPRLKISVEDLGTYKKEDIKRFNEKARELHRAHSKLGCPKCGRRFDSLQKLQKHVATCRGKNSLVVVDDIIRRFKTTKPKAEAPKWFYCCYCGHEFGGDSLKFHIPVCMEKWRNRRELLPEQWQTVTPRMSIDASEATSISDSQRIEFNAEAQRLYREHTMVGCRICGRKFQEWNALAKHSNTCRRKNKDAQYHEIPEDIRRPSEPKQKSEAPKWFVCVYCGMEFGGESLKIHMPQCLEKWRAARETLPPIYQTQTPRKIEGFERAAEMTEEERLDFNKRSRESYELHSMVKCMCGRTFDSIEKMLKHSSHCKEAKPAQQHHSFVHRPRAGSLRRKSTAAAAKGEAPKWYACCYCGEQFGAESLKFHMPQCLAKYRRNRERLPPQLQRDTPRPVCVPEEVVGMSEQERTCFNYTTMEIYKSLTMVSCMHCGRKFSELGKLIKHAKSCRTKRSIPLSEHQRGIGTWNVLRRASSLLSSAPKWYVCVYCGQEFGANSLAIHITTCKARFEAAREALPEEYQRPTPLPSFERAEQLLKMSTQQRITFNDDTRRVHNKAVLLECERCERKFSTLEKLKKHQTSCTGTRTSIS